MSVTLSLCSQTSSLLIYYFKNLIVMVNVPCNFLWLVSAQFCLCATSLKYKNLCAQIQIEAGKGFVKDQRGWGLLVALAGKECTRDGQTCSFAAAVGAAFTACEVSGQANAFHPEERLSLRSCLE